MSISTPLKYLSRWPLTDPPLFFPCSFYCVFGFSAHIYMWLCWVFLSSSLDFWLSVGLYCWGHHTTSPWSQQCWSRSLTSHMAFVYSFTLLIAPCCTERGRCRDNAAVCWHAEKWKSFFCLWFPACVSCGVNLFRVYRFCDQKKKWPPLYCVKKAD